MVRASLITLSLDHLTLGRAALYAAILKSGDLQPSRSESPQPADSAPDGFAAARRELDTAVDGLRRAGDITLLPLGLLTRAWLRFLDGHRTRSQADLDEAWEIAQRGPMPLFLADIHLTRARLFGRMPGRGTQHAAPLSNDSGYPWNKNPDGSPRGPADDLAAARRLIEKHGYWRRKEELEDAEAAARNWTVS